MKKRFAYSVVAVLLCGIIPITVRYAAGQTKPEENEEKQTFKVRTELVEVRAVVTDRKGRIVENLRREDFELLENNQPQDISFFSISQVEDQKSRDLAAGEASRTASAAQKSVVEQLSSPPIRTTVLYVDTIHLTFGNLTWIKQSLHRFLDEKMTVQDTVALVASGGDLGIVQQFTRDRQVLHYAIDRVGMGRLITESAFTPHLAARVLLDDYVALEDAKAIVQAEENIADKTGAWTRNRAQQILLEASHYREATLNTINKLIEQMVDMPGQRMIALFSEGFTQHGIDGWTDYKPVRSTIDRAVRSGVVIYGIDAKGLYPFSGADTNGYVGAAEHERLDVMFDLTADTGGEMYMNTNDLGGALGRALDANRFYYVLAYYLAPDADIRRLGDIKVRVRGHPEYKVRLQRDLPPSIAKRDSEDEAEQTPRERMLRAVNGALPKTGLSVSAHMDFIETKTDNQQASLTVFFEGDRIQYRQLDERHSFAVEVLYIIYDSDGKRVEAFSADVEGDLTPDRMAQARMSGFRFLKRLALKPGIYQARVGVRDKSTDYMGTDTAWVEVPDITHSRLALSSLILLDPFPKKTTDDSDIREGELKRVKTVQGIRLYPQDEVCGYFFSVYCGRKKAGSRELALKMELLQGSKPVKQSEWRPLSISKKDIDSKGWAYVGEKMDLAGLKPGIFELRIRVKDAGAKSIVQRTAFFGIE